ncbi:MAG: signal peptide peptidase SppA [Alphaproteobacteria bacterium]|jgi:signal peptide peptidase SppA
MWPFSSPPKIPVLRLSGPIGMASPLRPSMSLATLAGPIERAFNYSKLPAVAVVINSPGGSPTQSNLIFKRLRQLSEEKKKKVYVFCEDVAASGGYFLAVAGDEIYADDSSIVGSIGVIAASFGFVEALNKLGIERRVYTAGENKSILDPFKPAQEVDIERLKSIQLDIHEVFKGVVRSRRGDKLKGPESELFSGAFWVAGKAQELGLIDGITDVRTKMRELFGDKVVLHNIKLQSGGLLSRLRRPSLQASALDDAASGGLRLEFAEDLVSTVEKRMLWQRYGL